MDSYRDLLVWQKSMDLVVAVYEATASMPAREIYGLTNQMRRAAVSVPSNLAEGKSRSTPGDFARFISISRGSLAELETQLILTQRLDQLSVSKVEELLSQCDEVSRMLAGLRSSLR